jgi:plastocyanin
MRTRSLLLVLASAAVIGGGLATVQAADARESGVAPAAATRPAVAGGIDPRSGGFEIALGEWALSPEARAIRPGLVTLVISNRGKFRHGLELEIRRVDDDDRHGGGHRHGGDRDDDAKSIRLNPGEATRMTLNLAPGVYEIECFVSHHDDMGMRGVLEVREDAPLVKPPAAASQSKVEITGFAFKPATLKTTVGKTVTWRNADAAPHTATASQFSSPQLAKGGSYRRKFTRAGTYTYLCALHPGMRGKVVVTAGTGR